MSLITCPEFSSAVSDRAIACPKCAYPLKASKKPVTIQATSKEHKRRFLNGVMGVGGGIVLLPVCGLTDNPILGILLGIIPLALIVWGTGYALAANIRARWDNG